MEAIVLAGGFGTRLASRLEGVPKSMAPIAGHPFLEILLAQLRRAGCSRVQLSVGHLFQVIQQHFGRQFQGLQLDYVIETVPLGTGGAIRFALEQATEPSVLVLNGDTFLEVDYSGMMRFHAKEGAPITIAAVYHPNIARYGGVVIDGNRVVGYEEKRRSRPGPHQGPSQGWISAGVYVFNRKLKWPPALKENFSIELDFFVPEIGRLRPAAYKVNGYFLDIGVPEDLDRAQTELSRFIP